MNQIKKGKISFSQKFGSNYIKEKDKEYFSLEDSINKYDHNNLFLLDQANDKEYGNMEDYLDFSCKITPPELQESYGQKVIEIIDSINKSKIPIEIPKLPFGKHLSDDEFLELLAKCVSYFNYNLDEENLESIKNRLLINSKFLKNIFKKKQILKDLLENCLLTILTSNNQEDQDDNFNILTDANISTITPLLKLEFNYNNIDNVLNKKEIIDTFCSKIYLHNYYKSLDEFIPKFKNIVKDENSLKILITNYYKKYNIYFCELPQYMMAITIHTGNVYLNAGYLKEYFNKTDCDSQIIIREKIILNLAHELMHSLVRVINPKMAENFLIKSQKKTKAENDQLKFRDKFLVSNFHLFDSNESGNVFDFYFFNGYYFKELYRQEAEFFLDIKNKDNISEYKNQLNSIILNESTKKLSTQTVNKFKKLEKERPKCKRPGSIAFSNFESYDFFSESGGDKNDSKEKNENEE